MVIQNALIKRVSMYNIFGQVGRSSTLVSSLGDGKTNNINYCNHDYLEVNCPASDSAPSKVDTCFLKVSTNCL